MTRFGIGPKWALASIVAVLPLPRFWRSQSQR